MSDQDTDYIDLGFDPSEVKVSDSAGGIAPGRYLFECSRFEKRDMKNGEAIQSQHAVIGAEDADLEGRVHSEIFNLGENARWKIVRFLKSIFGDLAKGAKQPSPVGRTFVATVRERTYEGRTRSEFGSFEPASRWGGAKHSNSGGVSASASDDAEVSI